MKRTFRTLLNLTGYLLLPLALALVVAFGSLWLASKRSGAEAVLIAQLFVAPVGLFVYFLCLLMLFIHCRRWLWVLSSLLVFTGLMFLSAVIWNREFWPHQKLKLANGLLVIIEQQEGDPCPYAVISLQLKDGSRSERRRFALLCDSTKKHVYAVKPASEPGNFEVWDGGTSIARVSEGGEFLYVKPMFDQ